MSKVKILQTADIQVKNRGNNLFRSYEKNLKEIEKHLKEKEIDVYIIAGDLFEYCKPNDSERKLIYQHLSRSLSISTLKEIVLMVGNHDLETEKKKEEVNLGFNPINVFTDFLKDLDSELTNKVIYCSETKTYTSKVFNIDYHCYSLEDQKRWRPLSSEKEDINFTINPDSFQISLYHDIVKEYCDEKGLPIKKQKYDNLLEIADFVPNSLILAGDIHELWKQQNFVYPGSPQQHTHNEGHSLDISNEKIKVFQNKNKYVNFVEFDTDTLKCILDQIMLTDYVTYTTINIQPEVTFDKLNEYIESEDFNSNLFLGVEQSYIKIKLSNNLLQNEFEIFTLLNNKLSLLNNRVQITFSYEKLIQSELMDQKYKELIDVESVKSVDDLILSNDKLLVLFDDVLDSVLKKYKFNEDITESELKTEIVKLFTNELNMVNGESATNNHKIEFVNISTNSFMRLGNNSIKLNVPGITKIVGTNGIGKTTLFSMLKWVIKGVINDELPKNQKVKNNLLIFHDKDIENDTVSVSLQKIVNGVDIVLTRTATRSWKTSTTIEDKKSDKWKDFISNVDVSVKLDVIKNGETKSYTNITDVEKIMNKWYGNSLETIIFLNQAKLANILNLKSNELKELVLEYIGVTYLQNLETNLPICKGSFNLQKPVKNKEQITLELTEVKEEKANIEKTFDSKKEELNVFEKEHTVLCGDVTKLFKKQLDLGNIPSLISESENKKISIENSINSIVISDVKVIPEFTFEKKDTTVFESEIKSLNDRNEVIDISISSYLDSKNKLINEYNENKIFILTEIKNKRKQIFEELDNSLLLFDNDKLETTNKVSELKSSIQYEVQIMLDKFKLKQTELESSVAELFVDIKQIDSDISSLEYQLKNGVCKECKKPIADDWTIVSVQIQQKINNKNIEKTTLSEKHEKLKLTLKTVSDYVIKFSVILNSDFSELLTIKNINENLLFNVRLYIELLDKLKNIETEKLNKINLNNQTKNKYILIEASLNDKLRIDFTDYSSFDLSIYSDFDFTSSFDSLKKFNVNYIKLNTDYNEILTEKNNNSSKIIDNQNSIKLIENEYQLKFNEHNLLVNEVNEFNQQIKIDMIKLDNFKKQLKDIETQLLRDKGNLDLYNTLKSESVELDIKIKETKTIIETKKTEINNDEKLLISIENKIINLNNEYKDYVRYLFDNAVYSIYESLIKNHFKNSVFDYYRTYLNSTLNDLLSELNFKLFWNNQSELVMIDMKNSNKSYRPVMLSSGMETTFLGLALVFAIHRLNVKNNIKNIYIDELSGQLNKGESLSYDSLNYQELFVELINKFDEKSISIIDHNIENMFETIVYEVKPLSSNPIKSVYVRN